MGLCCLRWLIFPQIFLPCPLPPSVVAPTTYSLWENTAAAAALGVTHQRGVFIFVTGQNSTCAPGESESPKHAHHVWFLSPPLLRLYKAMEQQRGEKEGGGRHLEMLYQILLMIIIKHSELKERQKESLYPDGTWTVLQTNLNNVIPTTFSPQEGQ